MHFLRVICLFVLLQIAWSADPFSAHGQSSDELKALTVKVNELYDAGKYGDAIPIAQRALALAEKLHGPDHPTVGTALNSLGLLYRAQGRYAEAEPLYRRFISIREKSLGPDHPNVATALNNLAVLFKVQGRFREAENLYKRSLAIREKALGADHPQVGTSLGNLAQLYYSEARHAEAEPLAKRDLAIREKYAKGANDVDLGRALNNLALVYDAQGRVAEAEPIYQRALAIHEGALGPDHAAVGTILGNLAVVHSKQRRFASAEQLTLRALAVNEKRLGPEHPSTGIQLNNLAMVYQEQHRYQEAERLYIRSSAAIEKSGGTLHPQVGIALANVGQLRFIQSDWEGATSFLERSTSIATSRFLRTDDSAELNRTSTDRREIIGSSRSFRMMIRAAAQLAADNPSRDVQLRDRTFETAQWTQWSAAAGSLAQMAARQGKGDGKLAKLVRERQDLQGEWQAKDKALLLSRIEPIETRNREAEANLAIRIGKIDSRLSEIDVLFAREFPDYAALTRSTPLSIPAVQEQLYPHEALVLLLETAAEPPLKEETFVWVITKTDAQWARSKLGTRALAEEVAALRCGLDVSAWESASGTNCTALLKTAYSAENARAGKPLPFDLARAHKLYRALFGDVENLIAQKSLLIAASGPLTALPFQVLVTAEPSAAIPADAAGYAGADWLARRQSITVLPSVASLKALRTMAKSKASAPFIGFGNPLLGGPDGSDRRAWARRSCDAPGVPMQVASRRVRSTMPKFFRGGLANVEEIRAQYPLPETTDELCAVARSTGAGDSAVYLGDKANERTIKALSADGTLARARVVHFATHGLLAGEAETLTTAKAEPALILTPPAHASEEDDGLLTASEIAQLKLDADWVVLSACNTAGGDSAGPGSEALSGLARAFFYAGAKALLVSHWAVNSEATVKLVTTAFAEIKANPHIGRAEALRRSMLVLMAQGGYAHPANWAPFVLVGEGAAR